MKYLTQMSIGALTFLLCSACATSTPIGPYSTTSAENRDESKATQLTRDAVEIADKDPEKAETLLREALTSDLYHGPAHNDLGVLFFRQGKLYEAANEFEWARKLMPGSPDPRLNLALVLERAGQTKDAFAAYDSALEAAPEHVPTMQAYARLAVREGRHDDKTANALKLIALRGEDDAWRQWAQFEVARAAHE
jgi:Tfp pilus assembly protein PilF